MAWHMHFLLVYDIYRLRVAMYINIVIIQCIYFLTSPRAQAFHVLKFAIYCYGPAI